MDASLPSPLPPSSYDQRDQAIEALTRVPIDSITPTALLQFTSALFQDNHPTEARYLSSSHLASLQCSFTHVEHSLSEIAERLENSQQTHICKV